MGYNREPSPLYIPTRVNGNTVTCVLVDPMSWVNVIIKEIMLINFLHKDGYNASASIIHTHNEIFMPPLNSITFSVLVRPKAINLFFDIKLGSKLFKVKLGIPWLVAMNTVPSVIHKCLKFIDEASVHVVHAIGYRPPVACGSYSQDHFWHVPIGLALPRMDLLYQTYQKYKKGHIVPRVRYPPSPYDVSHRMCLKVDSDTTLA